jgi:serine phosphatase RsbU (regulator of sigma subunit)
MKPLKRNKYSVSVKVKIILVIALSIIFSLTSFLVNKSIIKSYARTYESEHFSENITLMKMLFNTQCKEVNRIGQSIKDYIYILDILNKPTNYKTDSKILSTKDLDINIFEVYKKRNTLLFKKRHNISDSINVITDSTFFNLLNTKNEISFCQPIGREFLYVYASRLCNVADTLKQTKDFGYIILAKVFDKSRKKEIESQINAKISFIRELKKNEKADVILRNYDGRIIGGICFTDENIMKNKLKLLNSKLGNVFALYIFILCIITILSYNILIIKPLTVIQNALNNQSEIIARELLYKRDEFGKIARLIIRFFQHRKLLNEKINNLSDTKSRLKILNKELTQTAQNLTNANEEIVLQQKAMTDNIYYASAVQRAAMIPSFEIEKVFKEHFIYFKPRDVVSGDFYWFYQHNDKYYVAMADCTGHGLSGSLMSMLGISFLNQIINQSGGTLTAAGILMKLREFIIKSLHQGGTNIEIYDGMDIGLCIFDFNSLKMEYAAAYNPLYLVRKNPVTKEYDLIKYKGDSMPVGIHYSQTNFSNYVINLQPNDIIYLFSDGYIDQFGGPENKKFMSKRLRELLLMYPSKSLTQQRKIIEKTFNDWRGDTFQVDDVTMIGLKI